MTAKELILGSIILSAVFIALVFTTGNTFGQRCAKLHPNDDAKQKACVQAF